jgi:hypothetical protein
MTSAMHGMSYENSFLGVRQNVSKMGKVVKIGGLIDAQILAKQILNFQNPIFFKTTILDC